MNKIVWLLYSDFPKQYLQMGDIGLIYAQLSAIGVWDTEYNWDRGLLTQLYGTQGGCPNCTLIGWSF